MGYNSNNNGKRIKRSYTKSKNTIESWPHFHLSTCGLSFTFISLLKFNTIFNMHGYITGASLIVAARVAREHNDPSSVICLE